jgi:hypothetical protein
MPDYEIIEWNEGNSDISNAFLKYCHNKQRWAFMADYVRLKVLYQFGGFYLDTDMLIIKRLDFFRDCDCFLCKEDEIHISAGIIGSIKGSVYIKKCLEFYDSLNLDDEFNLESHRIPSVLTTTFERYVNFKPDLIASSDSEKIKVFKPEFFYPVSYEKKSDFRNYKKYINSNTYGVHLWFGSWLNHDEFHYLNMREYGLAFREFLINLKKYKFYSKRYILKFISVYLNSLKKL